MSDQRLCDDARREWVAGRARVAELVPQDVLEGDRLAEPTFRFGPCDGEPAALGHRAEERFDLRPFFALLNEAFEIPIGTQKVDDFLPKRFFLGAEREVQVSLPPSGSERAEGSGFHLGARFSVKARGPSLKSGWDHWLLSSSQPRPSASS